MLKIREHLRFIQKQKQKEPYELLLYHFHLTRFILNNKNNFITKKKNKQKNLLNQFIEKNFKSIETSKMCLNRKFIFEPTIMPGDESIKD
ncbi:hypothetical protein BpHYR1_010926 [Brachionus plicatilis]|uniref:Uncharacterized protein n=1 Tax=Brachionus plicatilis TaxID=10195 RepID=A0A3M7QV54_BRAPC|nr:hypothetical protein BpHYR1_010926 [Brachionus plicatilis]